MPRSLRSVLPALAALVCLAAPAGAQAYTIGMSDQKLGMWQDPRFAKLGIEHVRLLMAYDNILRQRLLALRRVDGRRPRARRRRPGHDRPRHRLLHADADAASSTARSSASCASAIRGCRPTARGTRPTTSSSRRTASPSARRSTTTSSARSARAARSSPPTSSTPRTCSRGSRPSSGTRSARSCGACTPTRTPTTSARCSQTYTRALLNAVKGDVWLTEAGGIVRFGDPLSRRQARSSATRRGR